MNELDLRVLIYLSDSHCSKTTYRQISDGAKVSLGSVKRRLCRLEAQGYFMFEQGTKDTKVVQSAESLNRVIGLKKAYNLMRVHESGVVTFISARNPDSTLLLVGKFANGWDVPTDPAQIQSLDEIKYHPDFAKYEERLGRRIDFFHNNEIVGPLYCQKLYP